MQDLTNADISKAVDRLCETYEACGFDRAEIASELEAKAFELRGDAENAWPAENPVAFMPLP